MIKIYGIKNCNSVKKAFDWLDEHNIQYEFHDYKKLGIDDDTAKTFIKHIGLDKVINRKGTTWRKLSESEQQSADNEQTAITLIQSNTSLIKRPIIAHRSGYLVGFSEEEYKISLGKK